MIYSISSDIPAQTDTFQKLAYRKAMQEVHAPVQTNQPFVEPDVAEPFKRMISMPRPFFMQSAPENSTIDFYA